MGRIFLAIGTFFQILFNGEFAERVESVCDTDALPEEPPTRTEPPKPTVEKRPARSEALTFLAALQREARFVDFIQEPIDGYSDAQVGAAVREVHRECGNVIERMFSLQPITTDQEGSQVDVPVDFDPERYRLSGKVVDQPPYSGRLVHAGWQAAKCELPTWTGGNQAENVIAPAEVEIG